MNCHPGGITFKKINGKSYAYYQWREVGKQHSRRVKDDEFDTLSVQIEQRKRLQNQLKGIVDVKAFETEEYDNFRSTVRIGEDLVRFASPTAK